MRPRGRETGAHGLSSGSRPTHEANMVVRPCCAGAYRRVQGLVTDQSRAFVAIFEHELARVKCFELDAMRHADERGRGEALQDQSHQSILA
jgi:hypothetical protein